MTLDSDLPSTLSKEQVREVDRRAAEELGLPSIVLMENAAINAAAVAIDLLDQIGTSPRDAKITIICGGGNNGGDGFAMARQLHNWGASVKIFALKSVDELDGDAAVNAKVCQAMGLAIEVLTDKPAVEAATQEWQDADLIVDAMLGTGFSGEVREPMASVIRAINTLDGPAVVAVDVPSGLDCQTGEPADATIHATVTVTFVANKAGFETASASGYLGRVVVAEIGVPPELIQTVAKEE